MSLLDQHLSAFTKFGLVSQPNDNGDVILNPIDCQEGFHNEGGRCVADEIIYNNPPLCLENQHLENGKCVDNVTVTSGDCPAGYHRVDQGNGLWSGCVPDTIEPKPCPTGYYRGVGGDCVPNGYQTVFGDCTQKAPTGYKYIRNQYGECIMVVDYDATVYHPGVIANPKGGGLNPVSNNLASGLSSFFTQHKGAIELAAVAGLAWMLFGKGSKGTGRE